MKAVFIMSLVISLLCCPRIPNLYIDGYENCLTHNKPRWIFYLRSFEVFEKILPPVTTRLKYLLLSEISQLIHL